MQIAEWNVENLWMHTQVSISEFKIPSNLSQLSDKESFVCMERGKSYTRLATAPDWRTTENFQLELLTKNILE